jgi:hypothetical protein
MHRIVAVLLLTLFSAAASAAERRPIADVAVDAMTKDTQAAPPDAGDRHLALVWWVPYEFWQAVLARDTDTPQSSKDALLNALAGVSLVGIVQADVSPLGAFNYYPEDAVQKNLRVTLTDGAGKSKTLKFVTEIPPDLQVALGAIKPILAAAMGNLGKNFHFYVLDDRADSGRVADPYQRGKIAVNLVRNGDVAMTATIDTPLDSLFVARTCPNGKPAHVTWKYCPWNGERLKD